jgi:hypothetical protein
MVIPLLRCHTAAPSSLPSVAAFLLDGRPNRLAQERELARAVGVDNSKPAPTAGLFFRLSTAQRRDVAAKRTKECLVLAVSWPSAQ